MTEIIIAVIASFISPLVVLIVTQMLKRREGTRMKREAALAKQPELERNLRDELRSDADRYRKRAEELQREIDGLDEEKESLMDRISKWQVAFYEMKSEKARIEYELHKARHEIETLKRELNILRTTKEKIDNLDT